MHMQRIEKKNSLKYVYIYINCAFLEIDRNYFPVSLIFSFQPSTCKYTKLHSWNKRFQSRDSIVSYYWRKIQLSPPLLLAGQGIKVSCEQVATNSPLLPFEKVRRDFRFALFAIEIVSFCCWKTSQPWIFISLSLFLFLYGA